MEDALIIDVDDLLLDYTGGLGEFAKANYGKTIVGRPDDYNLCSWLNATQDEVEVIINHFNYNSFEFGELRPVDGFVVNRIQTLRAKYPKMKFIVVTKCGSEGAGGVVRNLNLRAVFGKNVFDEVIIISPFESKLPVYTQLSTKYNVVSVLDDHLGNIKQAQMLCLNTIVLRRSHNDALEKPRYTYVDDWFDMYEVLEKQIAGAAKNL